MNATKMCDCPRFDKCSAPICPLDTDWKHRVYRKGEPVCFYLLEFVKPDAKAQFRGSIGVPIYEAIQTSIDAISHRYAPLCRALERAKQTGSRLVQFAPTKDLALDRDKRHDDRAALDR
jgi:hypothetical protein